MSNLSDEDKNFLDGGNDSDAAFLEGDSNDESNLGPVTHGLAVVGERVLHALPDAAGFLGDLGADAVNVVRNKYRKMTGSDLPDERLYLPGMGPASEVVHKSFQEGEQKHGPIPQARNGAERILGSIAEGAATGLIGGPEGAGMGVASGASGGAAAGVTQEITDNPYAAYVAGLIGGLSPAGIHGIRSVRGSTVIARGASHPDFENAWSAVVSNEGGGSLEHPLTNEKSGAFGPAQVTPDTLRQPGYGIKPWDGTVADSVRVGRQKFAALLGKYDGDTGKAMAGYNWGEGNVDRAVRKYGADWLKHAPEETQNYVNKGLLKTYGGGDLPENGSVRPMDPQDIAGIMNDPEAARQISDTPVGDEATAQPIPANDENIISLRDVRQALDNGKVHDLLADKLDTAYAHEDAALRGEINMPPDEATANRQIADQLHAMLPEDHPYREMTSDLVNTWRSTEQLVHELHGEMPPGMEDIPNAADRFVNMGTGELFADNTNTSQKTPEVPYHEPSAIELAGGKPKQNFREPPRRSDNGHDDMPPPSEEPVTPRERLVTALSQASKMREEQDVALSKARGERLKAAKNVGRIAKGEAGFHAELSKLKGDYDNNPEIPFASIGNLLSQAEKDHLFDTITASPHLDYAETLAARSGLKKLLSNDGVILPHTSELKALAEVFPDAVDVVHKRIDPHSVVANILGMPRAWKASMDLSMLLRQGVPLIHTKAYWQAVTQIIKQLGPKGYEEVQNSIKELPTYPLMKSSDLALTNIGADLANREEGYQSTYAEHLPGENIPVLGLAVKGYNNTIGQVIRASDRVYQGTLNYMRAMHFNNVVMKAKDAGKTLSKNELKDLAEMINVATGRGDLNAFVPKFIRRQVDLNESAPILNSIFFAPRNTAAAIQRLNPAYYIKLKGVARREALKSLFAYTVYLGAILGVAKLAGLPVGSDPLSSDFATFKQGNTHVDVTNGMRSLVVPAAQLLSGVQHKPDGSSVDLTSGKFGDKTRLSVVGTFLRNKEAPIVAFAHDLMNGQDRNFNKLDSKHPKNLAVAAAKDLAIPMIIQDTVDGYNDRGKKGAVQVFPESLLGWSVNTYKPPQNKSVGRPKSSDSFLNDNSNLNDKFLSGTADSDDAFLKGNP